MAFRKILEELKFKIKAESDKFFSIRNNSWSLRTIAITKIFQDDSTCYEPCVRLDAGK